MIKRFRIKGQAIVEVVLAAGLVMVALTVLVAAVSKAVAANRLSKERVIATRLAQETIEWMNDQRNQMSFTDFCAEIDTKAGTNYCASPIYLSTLNLADLMDTSNNASSCPSSNSIIERSKTSYTVYVNFSHDCITTDAEYDVNVSWVSLGKTQNVTLGALLGGLE